MIYVDARHTLQTCPHCLNVDKKARNRGVRLYSCPVCGYKGNDDRIVAMNIYKRGLDKIRHTGFVSHGVQSTPLRCNAPPAREMRKLQE